jgi:hydrogenase maturation factor HypF (carbamoyltransferase family)
MNLTKLTRKTLGDLLGSLQYFGHCTDCRTQFMSVHDIVFQRHHSSDILCQKCADKYLKGTK